MKIEGRIVEVGSLQDFQDAPGIVLERADGSYVSIVGLSIDDIRNHAGNLFDKHVSITVS